MLVCFATLWALVPAAAACSCAPGPAPLVFFPDTDLELPRNGHMWVSPVPESMAPTISLDVDGVPWPSTATWYEDGLEGGWVQVVPSELPPAGSAISMSLAGAAMATWTVSASSDDEAPRWDGRLSWSIRSFADGWSCGEHHILSATAAIDADQGPILLFVEPVSSGYPHIGADGVVEAYWAEVCGGNDPDLLEDQGQREYRAWLVDVAGHRSDATEGSTVTSDGCGCNHTPHRGLSLAAGGLWLLALGRRRPVGGRSLPEEARAPAA